MPKLLACLATAAAMLMPVAATAEPIKLKLAFFTSDRSMGYLGAVKPFTDVINAEGKGLIEIEVHAGGKLGHDPAQQAQIVLDGTADIAFVVPGMNPDRFRDNAILELPGVYRGTREATLVYTRLIAENRLKDYDDFVVIGAFSSTPETIHTRRPIAALADLNGLQIRVNNRIEATALTRLGMRPTVSAVNQVLNAITRGSLDGAAVPESMLIEFGIGRVTTYHYLLDIGQAPLTLLMNRKTFAGLPKPAQDLIRKYSGEWTAEQFLRVFVADRERALAQLKGDPKRTVIVPSQPDFETAQAAFKTVIDDFIAGGPRNQLLLTSAQDQLAKLRATE